MNKFAKGSLMTAIGLLLVGIVIYTVGLIGGGKADIREMEINGDLDYFKDHLKVRMLNGLNLAWWTDGSFPWWDNDIDIDMDLWGEEADITHHRADGSGTSGQLVSGETIDVTSVTELNVELGGGYLYINEDAAADSGIKISVDAEDETAVNYYVKGGTLHIEGFKNKRWNVISQPNQNIIYVTLPEGFAFQKSELELGAGYIELQGGSYGKTSFEVGAGEISCNGITTGKLEVEIGAGAIETVDMNAEGLDCSVAMGSATIQGGTISGNIELSCDMGNLYLEMEGNEDEYNYDIECDMGSIVIGSREYSGLGKDKYIDNHAAKELKADCDLGSIEVTFMN